MSIYQCIYPPIEHQLEAENRNLSERRVDKKSSEREYNKSVTKAADKGRAAVTMKKWDYKNLKCISTSDVPAD